MFQGFEVTAKAHIIPRESNTVVLHETNTSSSAKAGDPEYNATNLSGHIIFWVLRFRGGGRMFSRRTTSVFAEDGVCFCEGRRI